MADTLSRRHFIKSTILQGASLTALGGLGCFKNTQHSSLPNIIIVYTDDQGYADVGVLGLKDLQHQIWMAWPIRECGLQVIMRPNRFAVLRGQHC